MYLEKIMGEPVITVGMDYSLERVQDIFQQVNFHHLPVVESGKLQGLISDKILFKSLSPYLNSPSEQARDIATLNKKAHQIMEKDLFTLPPKAIIRDAIHVFNTQYIECIPIVEGGDLLVGILSWRDIFKVIAKSQQK